MSTARLRVLIPVFLIGASLLAQGCASRDPESVADKPAPIFEVPDFVLQAKTKPSWNPHVRCPATVTTLRRVLGTDVGSSGGATFQGGGFKPGIPDRRALRPPCRANGIPTFVQLSHVQVGACTQINADGDWTCTLTDPTLSGSEDMRKIHIETDEKFRRRTGWSIPPAGTMIRIQGFVFWDPDHTVAAWHNHSGWEIHSFTAWRRAR